MNYRWAVTTAARSLAPFLSLNFSWQEVEWHELLLVILFYLKSNFGPKYGSDSVTHSGRATQTFIQNHLPLGCSLEFIRPELSLFTLLHPSKKFVSSNVSRRLCLQSLTSQRVMI